MGPVIELLDQFKHKQEQLLEPLKSGHDNSENIQLIAITFFSHKRGDNSRVLARGLLPVHVDNYISV